MAYAWITFAAAKMQLAGLLGDSGNVFWTDTELGLYIQEALRTWGALTLYWKERGAYTGVAGTAFFDLPTELPNLLGYTVTDRDTVTLIQYHLLETPTDGSVWSGTDQFTLTDVTNALNRRRDQFLVETGTVLSRFTSVIIVPVTGRVSLDDDVMDVMRMAWIDGPTGDYSQLYREDEWSISTANQTWFQNPATPATYSVSVTPPLSLQLSPPPIAGGTLDIVATRAGTTLNPAAANTVLGVPDDFAWVIKWGALADLLGQDGQGTDPLRTAYCEQRWQEGISAAKLYTSVMQTQVNDVTVYTDSLFALDTARPGWQNDQDTPDMAVMAGLNLQAFSPVPDVNAGISVDVVRRAPVPTADGDFLQVGREELEAILGYAQHLASFKMQGEDFVETSVHYQRMMRLAALKNDRLRANARQFQALTDRTKIEERERPREKKAVMA